MENQLEFVNVQEKARETAEEMAGSKMVQDFRLALISQISSNKKKKALQPSFFCDIISLMETKIDDNKASGFVWYVLCIVAVTTVWRSYNTLPAEFLLGAFSVWCLRNGMFYYEKASKIENE